MNKRSKKSIFKISFITLLIILSTIGIVLAATGVVSKKIELNENGFPESLLYKTIIHLDKKPDSYQNIVKHIGRNLSYENGNITRLSQGAFTALSGSNNVLCCEHGSALDNYPYTATIYNFTQGSPAQSYILSHINGAYQVGEKPHHTDVQMAWWSLINYYGISGNFENSNIGTFGKDSQVKVSGDKEDTSNDIPDTNIEIKDIRNYISQYTNEKENTYYEVFENAMKTFAPIKQKGGAYTYNELSSSYILEAISSYYKFAEKANPVKNNDYYNQFVDYFSACPDDEKNHASSTNPCKNATVEAKSVGWDKIVEGKWWSIDNSDKTPINLYRVEKILGKHTNIPKTRAERYDDMMKAGLNKKEIDEFLKYISQKISTDYSSVNIIGGDIVENDIYLEARNYEEFYNDFKGNSEISIDITNSVVNESPELNAFIVGPIKIKYNDTNLNYGYIENFKISTDKSILENMYTESDRITRVLDYKEYALINSNGDLCRIKDKDGNLVSNFPASNQEFYIVFSAGNGATQLTELGYTYTYTRHESAYLYYDLTYNGANHQDLAEVYSAHIWKESADVNVEFPIARSIKIKKEVPNQTDREFYFDVYLKCKDNVEYKNETVVEYNGTNYYKYTDTSVRGNNTVTVDLPKYLKSEGAPSGLVIETDADHKFYEDKENHSENSLWKDYNPAENNGVYEFNGISEGTVEAGYQQVTVVNTPIPKFGYISIDKKITSNKNNETFYAKLDVTTGNKTYTAIIPLRPSEDPNAGYKVYYNPNEVNENGYYICYPEYFNGAVECGTVKTEKSSDNDPYIHAKWEYRFKVEKDIEQKINYKVCEVAGPDENYIDKVTAENNGNTSKFWNEYKASYDNSSGRIKLVGEYGYDHSASAVILNEEDIIPININLELKKVLENMAGKKITSEDIYNFDVILLQSDKEISNNNELVEKENETNEKNTFINRLVEQTIEVKANEKPEKFNHSFYPLEGAQYYLIIKEKGNNVKWIDVNRDLNYDWNAEFREDGTIEKIWTKIDLNNLNNNEFSESVTNTNRINEGTFSINKIIENVDNVEEYFENEENKYREFIFEVQSNRPLYTENLSEVFEQSDIDNGFVKINEETRKIYVIINQDNYIDGVKTKPITWKANQSAPKIDIYEIDEHNNTFLAWTELGANRPKESVWNVFKPQNGGNGGHEQFLLSAGENVHVDFVNTPQITEKNFTITKIVDGAWDNDDVFYFRILSLDGTKTNVVEKYFNEEDITTINGQRVVKIAKGEDNENKVTVTSKTITWKEIEENPQFWITEVDQYGEAWSKAPKHDDSIWNHYTPDYYGTWTCQLLKNLDLNLSVEAKNTSNQVTLRKLVKAEDKDVTEQFFKECPKTEFRFKFYDEKGNDLTKTYFETDKEGYIVINEKNYPTGVTSEPIAASKGNTFVFIESLKDENLFEAPKTVIVNFDEDDRIKEVPYENIIDKRLVIDKVVEGATEDDFLDYEKFYFKVKENGKDVTNDLFETETVVVDKTAHDNGGVPSKIIYGNHTYEIIEYDKDGRDYEHKGDSEFWKNFKPENDGKWTVSLDATKGPSFVNAVNYVIGSITVEKEVVGDNITEADKNQKFPATVVIWSSEDSKDTDWFEVEGTRYSKNSTDKNKVVFVKQVEVSANKPVIIDGIICKGKAPTYQVYENIEDLPTNWDFVGHRVNGEFKPESSPYELEFKTNASMFDNDVSESDTSEIDNTNTIVIQNEKDTTDIRFFVEKTMLDQNGIQTTSVVDRTFYFDVYVEPTNAKYDGMDIEAIAKDENYNPGYYDEDGKYIRIDRLEVFIPKGSVHGETYSKVIDGNEVNYKVVEVDEAGHKFGDKQCTEDSLWKKFEPTMFSNGKWGNREGVWKGTLDGSNPTTSTAKIDAYNKITKVNINLEKWVWFENKLQDIEPGEEFKFIAEFEYKYENSNQGGGSAEEILITYEEQNWSETFELERGETIKYTITEVDPKNNVTYDEYLNGEESEFWKQFTPADNNGVITGTVDGSTANINLIGKNIKNVHSWLVITKDVSTKWLEEEEFEFKVFDGDKDVTKDLFEGAGNFLLDENGDVVLDEEGNPIDLYNSETNTIKVTYTTRTVYSNEVIWQSGTKAPTYTVKEVAYDKNKYKEPKDHDVTLKANEMETELTIENASRVAGYVGFINDVGSDFDRFSIEKIVEQNNLPITYDETFYVIVKEMNGDIEGDNVLTQEDHIFTSEGKDYIDDGETKYTKVKLNNGELAIELKKGQNAVSRIISWKKSETAPKYRIIEVDKYGNTFEQGSENSDSIWNNGYTPKNGTGIYDVQLVGQDSPNVEPTQVKVVNAIDDESTNITITKVIKTSNGNSDIIDGENFYFKVEKSNGKTVEDVTKIFFDEKTLTKKNNETGEVEGLVHLHVGNKIQYSKDVYLTQGYTYTVIETDQYGEPYDKNKDYTNIGSVWEEYKPSDDIGKWEISKNQTEVIAENDKTIKQAELKLTKQVSDEELWDNGASYEFNIDIKFNADEKNIKHEEFKFTKKDQTWSESLTWKSTEKAPEVKFEEPSNPNVEIKINGKTVEPGKWYKLADKDGRSYTFTATNHNVIDYSAHFNLIKTSLNPETTYRFKYAYSRDNGKNWIEDEKYILDVKADGTAVSSEDIEWKENEQTPKFKVWEIGRVTEKGEIEEANLEKISAINAVETSEIKNNDKIIGIEGTLNSDENLQVSVMANNGPDHYGDIKVIKEFVNSENKQGNLGDLLEFLAKQYKDKKGIDASDVKFKFVLNISYGVNSNKKFTIDNKEYSNYSEEKEITLEKFIDLYKENKFNDKNETTIIEPDNIGWSGDEAPRYSIDEFVYTNSFWKPEITTNNGSGELKCKKCGKFEDKNKKYVEVKVKNTYDVFSKEEHIVDLLTSLAGNVWVETPNYDKGAGKLYDGIMNTEEAYHDENNKLINPKDSPATNIYAVPHRYVVDGNGAIIKDLPNGQYLYEYEFMVDTSKFYDYITDGSWKFDNVYVPAFNLDNDQERAWYEAGYSVKYVIEFYYDGVKYKPTKELVEGDANDYLQLNDDYDKYFDNSCAIENDRNNEEGSRTWYNNKFATVKGLEKMNSTGESTGEILNSEGKHTTTVDYTREIIGSGDGSNIVRTNANGTIEITKPVQGTIENIKDLKDNFMCASTTELGLGYFFKEVSLEGAEKGERKLVNVIRSVNEDPNDNNREKIEDTYIYKKPTKYIEVDYAQHINLGLIQREQADVLIDKKIESAVLIINDKMTPYSWSTENHGKNIKFEKIDDEDYRVVTDEDSVYSMIRHDVEKASKELNIYTSDYSYRTDMYNDTEVKDAFDVFYNAIYEVYDDEKISDPIKSKELQVYVTYSITVKNEGPYAVQINSIDDYSDSSLEFVDVGPGAGYAAYGLNGIEYPTTNGGLYAYIEQDNKEETGLKNVFDDVNENFYKFTFTGKDEVSEPVAVNDDYNKMTFTKTIDLPVDSNSAKTYYVTYRVKKAPEDLENNVIIGIKNNVAEIASFTPYLEKNEKGEITKYAAVIDKDSAPGNYNIEAKNTRNYMEDDTDLAHLAIGIDDDREKRSFKGNVWLDNKDSKNGEMNPDDYKISGINTKLVEVIDLPVRRNDAGEIVYSGNNYTEYEFYWNGTETTTDNNGVYTINGYIDGKDEGSQIKGLVPGNYVVRFFYGDKDTKIVGGDDVIRINGEDYKTTTYDDKYNGDYVDNEWYSNFESENTNKARDNEARRLKIIKETQTLTNSNTAIFDIANYADARAYADEKTNQAKIIGIIATDADEKLYYDRQLEAYTTYKNALYGTSNEDGIKVSSDITNGSTAYKDLIYKDGYSMFADTAKINLKIESPNSTNENSIPLDDGTKIQEKEYKIENVNLGLEERPRTKLYLDKQAEEITLTTSAGKTFFHVAYDFDYVVEENVEKASDLKNKKAPDDKKDDFEYNLIDYDKDDKLAVWVGLKPQGEVIGINNLQALDNYMIPEFDMKINFNGEETNINIPQKAIMQGFRYINIDSTVLQGLKLDIRYRFTAINLSETDKYGKGLEEIMKDGDENRTYIDRAKMFERAIGDLSSSHYTLDRSGEYLLFRSAYGNDKPKRYGEYLGHSYYQGNYSDEDLIVKTKPRQIIDYIDNDIEFDVLANPTWATEENNYEQLQGRVDDFIFVNGKVQNEAEVEYKTIATSIDSDTNVEFVKELEPIEDKTITIEDDDGNVSMNSKVTAFITISTSKIFAGTDKGNTGMDNFAEFCVIENTVGRRDVSVVTGNYDPRGGATTTTERDETATEIVTLSPPTGNEENDRTMLIVISIICTIALASGTAVGLKLKFSGKSKSKTE